MNHRQYKKLRPDLPAPHILQYAGLRSTQFNSTKNLVSVALMDCDVFRREQNNLEFPTVTRMSWINEKCTETIYDCEKI